MAFFGGSKRRQFERLAQPMVKPLYQAALRLTNSPEWAEDLTQDTLVRAYERFEMFTLGTNFRAWLFTILTNLYLNDCERSRRRPILISINTANEEAEEWEFPSADKRDDPLAFLLHELLPDDLQAALDALKEEFRIAVLLVDMEEMSYQEASEALGIPIGTVRSRVSRGRTLMRRTLIERVASRSEPSLS